MGFLDTVSNPEDEMTQTAGQMGSTTRPKQRFIDKVLMKQRDKGQGQTSGSAYGGLAKGAGNASGMPFNPNMMFQR